MLCAGGYMHLHTALSFFLIFITHGFHNLSIFLYGWFLFCSGSFKILLVEWDFRRRGIASFGVPNKECKPFLTRIMGE